MDNVSIADACEAPWKEKAMAGRPPQMLKVSKWAELFSSRHPDAERFLHATYGSALALRDDKRRQYLTALKHYGRRYGTDDQVFIVRAPGRINLMGRHVDHRGGDVNVIAINDECIAIISARDDDIIELSNSSPDTFADDRFSIEQLADELTLHEWFTCINSPRTIALVNHGGWENYIKGAILRLHKRFQDRCLKGMRMSVHGNIPIGSGLSSSSALVVATAKACIKINQLPVAPRELVDLCGEAEWFVGTRGGSGDHGAIRLGRCGDVANMSFFPLAINGYVPFPEDYRIVIVNSGIQAQKMSTVRAEFNSRILAYVVGEALFKLAWPELAERIEHLRDISVDNLGVPLEKLYEMLLHIPRQITYGEIQAISGRLSDRDRARLEELGAANLQSDKPLQVRNVLLYGIAEIRRAQLFSEYLKRGDEAGLRRLFKASHDGDRVVSYDGGDSPLPWTYQVTDEYLQDLSANLKSGARALQDSCRLEFQPGRYECSVPRIDWIVDMAYRFEGVLGAQMAGAGLGGCAMVIAREDCCEKVMSWYAQAGLAVHRYCPVDGADVVSLS